MVTGEREKSEVRCYICLRPSEKQNLWKRVSTRIYSGLPGSSSEVKQTIEYLQLYTCEQCKKKFWVESFPNFINDPDVEGMS